MACSVANPGAQLVLARGFIARTHHSGSDYPIRRTSCNRDTKIGGQRVWNHGIGVCDVAVVGNCDVKRNGQERRLEGSRQ